MGRMATMDKSGDVKVEWTEGNVAEVDAARQTFNRMTQEKGYAAFRVRGRGERGEQIREFDPSAESIILAQAMQGG